MKKKTRITIDDRINLQAAIAKGISLTSVCKLLKKNRTTIYRELTHYYYVKTSTQSCSHCARLEQCKKEQYIRRPKHEKCKDFEAIRCDKLKRYPYVCNGCNILRYCKNDKRYYDCSKAEAMSLQNRISTRKRKLLSKDDISIINNIVSPLIKENGQSIHHVEYARDEKPKARLPLNLRKPL